MREKILGLLAIALVAVPVVTNAVPYTYYVTGTFTDGGAIGGSFSIDPADNCNSYAANVSIETTAGADFPGTTYTGGTNGCGYAFAGGIYNLAFNDGGWVLSLSFSQFLTGTGTFALSTDAGSYEYQDGTPEVRRGIASGYVSTTAVAEPGTFALLGLGLLGLGLRRRREI